VLALVLTILASSVQPGDALLLEGATVYVSPGAKPVRASVLIRAGKVAFVGDSREARSRSGDGN
jgi:predicted amidohydrolase YtcJ